MQRRTRVILTRSPGLRAWTLRFLTSCAAVGLCWALVTEVRHAFFFHTLPQGIRADSILVVKSDRRLLLFAGGEVLTWYPIALGSNPSGHKYFESDGKTPEGLYRIDRRNPGSRYSFSLHISYPDAGDRRHAEIQGRSPGGDVMIHGMPAGLGFLSAFQHVIDWTDGGIAVGNREIEEIARAVPDGTPIRIVP